MNEVEKIIFSVNSPFGLFIRIRYDPCYLISDNFGYFELFSVKCVLILFNNLIRMDAKNIMLERDIKIFQNQIIYKLIELIIS
jgi:hypothetical protein